MADLASKRERQARRLLRVCLREFGDGCLESYVDDFEGGKLERVTHCALDAMSGADSDYLEFRDSNGRAAAHVENIFEGYGLFNRAPLSEWVNRRRGFPCWSIRDDAPGRRWIYEACIEELARRGAESVEPVTSKEAVHV